MDNRLAAWWNVLVQIVEFLFTGATFYMSTEQGQREFNEVLTAFEAASGLDLNADGVVGEQFPVSPSSARRQADENTVVYNRTGKDNGENVSVFHGR